TSSANSSVLAAGRPSASRTGAVKPRERPSPRSTRLGVSASSMRNCSATRSGRWFGSITPPEPSRIRLVRCPIAATARSTLSVSAACSLRPARVRERSSRESLMPRATPERPGIFPPGASETSHPAPSPPLPAMTSLSCMNAPHVPLSLLDLVPISEGMTPRDAINASMDAARVADRLGYERLWFAEHHNTDSLASSATSLLIDRAASLTERIRVGSGGIMLPNHSPLAVIEQFGTLVQFHGDRIDLGLGRAPGTDQLTAQLLARTSAEPAAFIAAVEQMRAWSQTDPGPG